MKSTESAVKSRRLVAVALHALTACFVLYMVLPGGLLPAQVQAAPPGTASPALGGAPKGKLAITITYAGRFYRETFAYAPDAPNIRHYALILPADLVTEYQGDVARVFTGIQFGSAPGGPVQWRPEVGSTEWVAPYLYPAPGGVLTVSLAPGEYAVWAAFLAAPLSRAEAGVGDDAILWAGVTGGGASTRTPATVTVAAGETTALAMSLTDANGWACPWLYVYDGDSYIRTTEILRNQAEEPPAAYREVTRLGRVPVVDGAVRLRLAEEKDEITTLDALTIVANGVHLTPDDQPTLASADEVTMELARDEQIDLTFTLPPALAGRAAVQVVVITAGYYHPVSQESADPLPSWNDGAARQAIVGPW